MKLLTEEKLRGLLSIAYRKGLVDGGRYQYSVRDPADLGDWLDEQEAKAVDKVMQEADRP